MAQHDNTDAAPGPDDQRYRAPALDKGLDILELLAEEAGGLTRAEIVRATERGPSEIYRMVERLVARGYLRRSPEGDRFSLTMKLFSLGARHPPLRRLVAAAQPAMDAFSAATGQSVHLVVADQGAGHVIAQASSVAPWEFRVRIGARLDLDDTGSGQALTAFQGAGDDPDLAAIRAAGHRIGPSGQLAGVTDISVPVGATPVVAVLTCPHLPLAGPDRGADVDGTLTALLQAASRIVV